MLVVAEVPTQCTEKTQDSESEAWVPKHTALIPAVWLSATHSLGCLPDETGMVVIATPS